MPRSAVVLGLVVLVASVGRAGSAMPATPHVFVTAQDDAAVSEIDPRSAHVIRRITTGKGPANIGIDATGSRVAVTHPDAKTIDVIDVATGQLRSLGYDGEPFGVAIDGDAIYVSDWSKDVVARIDAATGRVTGSVQVGKSPAGLVLDRRRQRLYVAARESGGIAVVDLASMHVVADVATGTAPFALAVAPDGRRVYVANVRSNDLAVIDADSLRKIDTIAAGSMPYGVAVAPDRRFVLVTNQHGNTLSIVDIERHAVVATVPVGRYPEGVVVVEGRAYVANWFSGDISVVDIAHRHEVGRIKVGEGPRNLVVAGDREAEH